MEKSKLKQYNVSGNSLLLLDLTAEATHGMPMSELAKQFSQSTGADGLLTLSMLHNTYQLNIFNRDGSDGEFCGNGVIAAATFLHEKNTDITAFEMKMADRTMPCQIEHDGSVSVSLEGAHYLGPVEMLLSDRLWQGHRVHVGNPHSVFFERVSPEFAKEHGPAFENMLRGQKQNIEFVEKINDDVYRVVVYERGVGLTQSCGSGALAIAVVLLALGESQLHQKIKLIMPGGPLFVVAREHGALTLNARATEIGNA